MYYTEIVCIMFNICYFNSNILFLCQIHEPIDTKIKNVVEPQRLIIYLGEALMPGSCIYCCRGWGWLFDNYTTWTSLFLLVGSCYIFNMVYPSRSRNVFLFVETVLMEICKEPKRELSLKNV